MTPDLGVHIGLGHQTSAQTAQGSEAKRRGTY